jgi:hypothetical protein
MDKRNSDHFISRRLDKCVGLVVILMIDSSLVTVALDESFEQGPVLLRSS